MLFRPADQRPTPGHQFVIGCRHLPGPVHPTTAGGRFESHQVSICWIRLEIVKTGCGVHRLAKGDVAGHIVNHLAIKVDGAAIHQALKVFCGVLDGLTSHRGTQSAISNEQIIRRFTTIRDDLIRVRWPTTTQSSQTPQHNSPSS